MNISNKLIMLLAIVFSFAARAQDSNANRKEIHTIGSCFFENVDLVFPNEKLVDASSCKASFIRDTFAKKEINPSYVDFLGRRCERFIIFHDNEKRFKSFLVAVTYDTLLIPDLVKYYGEINVKASGRNGLSIKNNEYDTFAWNTGRILLYLKILNENAIIEVMPCLK